MLNAASLLHHRVGADDNAVIEANGAKPRSLHLFHLLQLLQVLSKLLGNAAAATFVLFVVVLVVLGFVLGVKRCAFDCCCGSQVGWVIAITSAGGLEMEHSNINSRQRFEHI